MTIPYLAARAASAGTPFMVGFGFTERPVGINYNLDVGGPRAWFLDAMGIRGRSGAPAIPSVARCPLRWRFATHDGVQRLVLIGPRASVYADPGLDAVWGA